jgi:hypothetical protein
MRKCIRRLSVQIKISSEPELEKSFFKRNDFTDFMDLYNTIRGQVKDKDLKELLLTELQGYLINHQKVIRNLEQSNTTWHSSISSTVRPKNSSSVVISLEDPNFEVVIESNIFSLLKFTTVLGSLQIT